MESIGSAAYGTPTRGLATTAARDSLVARDWISRGVPLAVLAVSAAYVSWHLGRGLVPHDDGSLAQAATRLLDGELPHRDFDDVYTGGLAFLNAAGFRLFGTSLFAMRLVLLTVFLAWVPAVYYIASRFVPALAAGAVTLLAVVWSVPNYPAPMPSWYNLFLATFGIVALFRHLEDGRRRWLFLAGMAGGLSVLAKVVGVYYIAAVLLFLVFRAHALSRNAMDRDPRQGRAYAAFATASLVLFVTALFGLVRARAHLHDLIQLVLPGASVALLLIHREWSIPGGSNRARFASLARLLVPFLCGVAIPIAVFVVPYLRSGSLGALIHGVFVQPTKRFGFADAPFPPVHRLLAGLPLVVLVIAARRFGERLQRWHVVALGLLLTAVWLASGYSDAAYGAVWNSASNLLPVIVVTGVALLTREDAGDTLNDQRTVLLLSVTGVWNMVRFPFSLGVYFFYVAPLAILTAVAIYRHMRPARPELVMVVLGFYALFAMTRLNTAPINGKGIVYVPWASTPELAGDRAGLSGLPAQAKQYNELIPLLRQHAKSEYIWASPDAPEVYFLAGYKNPTRSFFEFFDDTTGRTARILQTLADRRVNIIALNAYPEFSFRAIPVGLYRELVNRYPHSKGVGRFQVRWRE
jgi:hypothetical protein